jgi:circadian clock protein KaiB
MGQTSRSQRAIVNLRRFCEDALQDHYELTIVDVLECPQIAEDERILATPTLIREAPAPVRRIVGDLSDRGQMSLALDLHPEVEA